MLLITPISPNFKGLKCSVFGCFRALQSRNIYGIMEKINLTGVSGWTDKKSCWTMKQSKPPLPVRSGPQKRCWPTITYCGKCYACRCGHHNVCRELKVLGCIVDGIFQEYVVMPRSQVYEYDASKMTYQQAALCEPFTIGLQANWRGDVRPGDVVLVHGGGPIGLIVANIAKSRGATVIVSEPNESRLAMAKDFGADYSINPMKEDLDAFINKLTDGEGVNVIFEAAGVPALLAHATSQLSPAGRLVAMTFGKEPIPVNFKEINAKELTILGTRHQYQKFPEVVKILPDHLKEVDEITTHVFKAEDFQKAFDTLADRNSGAGKVVLTFA